MGAKERLDVDLELDRDGTVRNGATRRNFKAAGDWDHAPFEKLACLTLSALFGSYQVDLQRVSGSICRLSVTVTDMDFVPTEDQAEALESALQLVFNCVGALQGRKVMVEVVV